MLDPVQEMPDPRREVTDVRPSVIWLSATTLPDIAELGTNLCREHAQAS